MSSQWEVRKVGGFSGYTRKIASKRGLISGSVWYDPYDRRYKWMASSDVGFQSGWSRTTEGAKRACARAMLFMKRWLDAQAK